MDKATFISKCSERRREGVEIPEAGTVYVQSLTVEDSLFLAGVGDDISRSTCEMIRRSVCDESGKCFLADATDDEIYGLGVHIVQRLTKIANELSGLGDDDDVASAEKN